MENDDRFQLYLGFKISLCLRVFKDEIALGVHLAFFVVGVVVGGKVCT
jgi:hypothetical protein